MNNFLLKIFGIQDTKPGAATQREIVSSAHLERARQEFRQTVQRVDSGARVLEKRNGLISTWDEGLQLIARKNDD